MKKRKLHVGVLAIFLSLLLSAAAGTFAQDTATQHSTAKDSKGKAVFKQEELDQILAPIALYPDSLISQILMASTYPLEIVEADRWAKENKHLKDKALAKALEVKIWDPSVKSLVNFPQILEMMNSKLDWTQKLGDAFLAQQKDVLATIQKLRQKADEAGNLKTTPEQNVIVEKETKTIIINSADPEVVYVPIYNPTVVYGTWWYPYYPPFYYYPPYYAHPNAAYAYAHGVPVGAAWGYAYGNCNWHNGDVNIDVNRNIDINNNINRGEHAQQYNKTGQAGSGSWQHDPSHRQGVSYRDETTAQKFNKASTTDLAKSRDDFRGRAETGRQDLNRGSADQFKNRQDLTMNQDRQRSSRSSAGDMKSQRGSGSSAFDGIDRGSSTRQYSNRGRESMSGMSGSRASYGGGSTRAGGGGGGRGGGGRR